MELSSIFGLALTCFWYPHILLYVMSFFDSRCNYKFRFMWKGGVHAIKMYCTAVYRVRWKSLCLLCEISLCSHFIIATLEIIRILGTFFTLFGLQWVHALILRNLQSLVYSNGLQPFPSRAHISRSQWSRSPSRRRLAAWNRHFESRWGHGCLSLVFICCVVLCRYRPLRRADHSSREVWLRSLNIEEAQILAVVPQEKNTLMLLLSSLLFNRIVCPQFTLSLCKNT
jgi:hypothetical protein